MAQVVRVALDPTTVRRGRLRRLRRALYDFALTPLLVMAAFTACAALAIVGDQTESIGALNAVRASLRGVIGDKAASATLQAVATGLVTVTSITFSVLLLAVQQTASNLSPVVFDQFMRRRSNQLLLGFFVGLALFAYVVMAAVQDDTPPIIGAALATVLTLVALLILLLLVYSTINQMQPASVMRSIYRRVLQAREREEPLIAITRRRSESPHDAVAQLVSEVTGYVNGLDHRRLARVLEGTEDVEIVLHVTTGHQVTYGDVVAEVRDGDVDRAAQICREVGAAIEVSRQRDLSNDPTTGIDEIGTIAWTTTSSAKHSPEVAQQALHLLQDIGRRWMRHPVQRPAGTRALRIVYEDGDVDRLLDVVYSVFVAAHESQQHQVAAHVLEVYRALLPDASAQERARMERDLASMRPLLAEMPQTPQLQRAGRAVLGRDAVPAPR